MKTLSILFAVVTAVIVILMIEQHGFLMQSDQRAFDQDFATLKMLGVIAGLLSVGAAVAHLVNIRHRY
jgi:integral membrane sensor domain MASE1